MFQKLQRKSNKALLDLVRSQPCAACGTKKNVESHHVTTRGSGGKDEEDNVMPLCTAHHYAWHMEGPLKLSKKFRGVLAWLVRHKRMDIIEKATARADGLAKFREPNQSLPEEN